MITYVRTHGSADGWLDSSGNYFISGYQVGRAALSTPPLEGDARNATLDEAIDVVAHEIGWGRSSFIELSKTIRALKSGAIAAPGNKEPK